DGAVVGPPRPPGTGDPDDEALLPVDVRALFVVAVDGAGNASSPVLVKDVELVSSLGGKIAGSPFSNPNSLDVATRFDGTLFPSGTREASAADGVFAANDGVALTTRGEG